MAKKTPQTKYAILHLPTMELVRNAKRETMTYATYNDASNSVRRYASKMYDYSVICFTDIFAPMNN